MSLTGLPKLLARLWVGSAVAAAVLTILSGAAYINWSLSNLVLRRQALDVTQATTTPSGAIIALNNWVYSHRGFAKNKSYFIVKALGPTPVQVLQSGGDCSDKSRLLSAMLYQVGISSGLVMIYPCANCSPIHTVVEAEYEKGRMIVDPIWNIDYPAADGHYYGARELARTSLGRERLRRLKAESIPSAKIIAMPETEATFDYARSINWNKNAALRAGAAALRSIGVDPALMLRPRILEDPELMIAVVLIIPAIALFTMAAVLYRAPPKAAVKAVQSPD